MEAANEVLLNDGGHRRVIHFLVEHVFKLGISAGDRVAYDYDIGVLGEVLALVAFRHRNPESLKLKGHRRIHVFIRTSDFVSLSNEHPGKRSHSRTAYADQVIMLQFQILSFSEVQVSIAARFDL